jgi:hypothetical protein
MMHTTAPVQAIHKIARAGCDLRHMTAGANIKRLICTQEDFAAPLPPSLPSGKVPDFNSLSTTLKPESDGSRKGWLKLRSGPIKVLAWCGIG